ncbi:MAG TPA: DinB family protein [Pyrinomonadaceae bacterium]|nr:DinB family protein [Pyrinomonadaceae bacterium]
MAKLDEQIDLLAGIVRRLPAGQTHFTPELPAATFPQPKSLGQVLGHLLQCLAGFVAVLHAAHPQRLAHLLELKRRPVNHVCERDEALGRIEEYRAAVRAAFPLVGDDDLARPLPTVFAPEGEAVLTLLLGNFEHLVNHKHELFYYARLLGLPLASRDLYRFRPLPGEAAPAAAPSPREVAG